MSPFNEIFLQEIKASLDNPPDLVSGEFDISFDESKDPQNVQLRIVYCLDRECFFEANISRGIVSLVDINTCPGLFFSEDRSQVSSLGYLIPHIQSWITRLTLRVQKLPLMRRMKKQEEQLQTIKEKISDIEDELITPDEVAAIRDLLLAQINALRQEIEDLKKKDLESEEEQKDLNAEIDALKSRVEQLETLSDRVEVLSKQEFATSLIARLFGGISSPENTRVIGNTSNLLNIGTKIIGLFTDHDH